MGLNVLKLSRLQIFQWLNVKVKRIFRLGVSSGSRVETSLGIDQRLENVGGQVRPDVWRMSKYRTCDHCPVSPNCFRWPHDMTQVAESQVNFIFFHPASKNMKFKHTFWHWTYSAVHNSYKITTNSDMELWQLFRPFRNSCLGKNSIFSRKLIWFSASAQAA